MATPCLSPRSTINATTPTTLQIYVFGSTATTPNFMPVTDIDPTTVKVNGVAFPGATLVQDPDTANYLNGIPDAIITISPRALAEPGQRLDDDHDHGPDTGHSPLPNYTWTGTATVTVTGGSVGSGRQAPPSPLRRPARSSRPSTFRPSGPINTLRRSRRSRP